MDPAQLEALNDRLEQEQRPVGAIFAGGVTTILSLTLWTALSISTGQRLTVLSIPMGILIGLSIRFGGKGITPLFRWIGTGFALGGCLIGTLATLATHYAQDTGLVYGDALAQILGSGSLAFQLSRQTVAPIDLIFYALTIYESRKLALRKLSAKDIAPLAVQSAEPDA